MNTVDGMGGNRLFYATDRLAWARRALPKAAEPSVVDETISANRHFIISPRLRTLTVNTGRPCTLHARSATTEPEHGVFPDPEPQTSTNEL